MPPPVHFLLLSKGMPAVIAPAPSQLAWLRLVPKDYGINRRQWKRATRGIFIFLLFIPFPFGTAITSCKLEA